MKKKTGIVITVAAGALLIAAGINQKTKKAVSVSIIGGADGPTSVFLAGKVGGDFAVGLMIAGVVLMAAGIVWWYSKRKR